MYRAPAHVFPRIMTLAFALSALSGISNVRMPWEHLLRCLSSHTLNRLSVTMGFFISLPQFICKILVCASIIDELHIINLIGSFHNFQGSYRIILRRTRRWNARDGCYLVVYIYSFMNEDQPFARFSFLLHVFYPRDWKRGTRDVSWISLNIFYSLHLAGL